ncbi:MAG: porin family protein [Flavobacteriaceae bacterium]|nr:porin family protein [Flavobacteriaceae bacterium]
MKKLFLLMISLVVCSLHAQNVTFGAKAGLNFASLTGDDAEDIDGRTSLHLGATAEFSLSETFSIQPELLYSGQGFTANESDVDITGKMDYINLPIMAKFYAAEGLSLEIGPQIGFLLSAKAEGKSEGNSVSIDFKDESKSVDFGANFGIGYKLDSGINFGFRYNLGLISVSEEDSEDLKSNVLQLSVGYNF